jgi:hypothetical protein
VKVLCAFVHMVDNLACFSLLSNDTILHVNIIRQIYLTVSISTYCLMVDFILESNSIFSSRRQISFLNAAVYTVQFVISFFLKF